MRVDPDLYDRKYFLTDNEGWKEYQDGLDRNIHPKFRRALEIADVKKGDSVLDIGCGRGELLYYCAKKGAKSLGIDYSKDAIQIANETIKRLPAEPGVWAKAEVGDIGTYNFTEKYDSIFMIEIVEHMFDYQLEESFKKIKDILKEDGRLIIMTPNYLYEKYLSPAKLVVNIPFNMIKWPMRILRGKYQPKNISEFMNKIFKIRINRGELNRMMHVNVITPARLKKFLAGFGAEIRCEDHSRNLLSVITRRWLGRDIVAIARKSVAVKDYKLFRDRKKHDLVHHLR